MVLFDLVEIDVGAGGTNSQMARMLTARDSETGC
jgi:hypothetical protein